MLSAYVFGSYNVLFYLPFEFIYKVNLYEQVYIFIIVWFDKLNTVGT